MTFLDKKLVKVGTIRPDLTCFFMQPFIFTFEFIYNKGMG